MTTKLTLSLNNGVIRHAKSFAKKNKTSLSVLVENYFRYLTEVKYNHTHAITPMVKELTGMIELPDEFDHKKEYAKYIAEKYK